MSPILKKPAAKKKIVVKKTTRPTVKKAPAKPVLKRGVKTAVKPAAKPALKPALKPVRKPLAAVRPVLPKAGVRPGLEGKTNQDVINVIYKAAEELRMPAWTLLSKVKLEHLVDARTAPYTGPAIGDLPDLTAEQKAVLSKTLLGYVRPK